jgi:hypothetical protein
MGTFWNFERWSKIDVLEDHHSFQLCQAIKDRLTQLDRSPDGNYIIYGPDQALLVAPERLSTYLTLEMFLLLKNALGPITDHCQTCSNCHRACGS